MTELKIEHVNVEQLKPYKNNAKIHSPDQISQIADSIHQFGFVNPILIDENGEIIAGHGRFEIYFVTLGKDMSCLDPQHWYFYPFYIQ